MSTALIETSAGQLALADLPISAAAVAVLAQTSNAGFAADDFFKAHNITPSLAGEYMEDLEGSAPTENQALAALRQRYPSEPV